MKKLLVILSVLSASVFTSCDNENSVNPQPLGTATVKGTVEADFDLTNNSPETTYDKVANKKVIVSISDDYNEYFTETSTDANGNYSIEVKIGNRELYVEVFLVDFKQNVKFESKTEEKLFTGKDFKRYVTVVKGGEYILDLKY